MSSLPTETLEASDMKPGSLQFLADSFRLAHRRAPGGLSIEVGTRRGGSAFLMLSMIRDLYPERDRPMLFTVDPYGKKPYFGGDGIVSEGLYGAEEYLAMKRLLSGFSNHAHWYLESSDFFLAAPTLRYWHRGELRRMDKISFALLDGDHDHLTISAEVLSLFDLMAPAGVILVDNVDRDEHTLACLGNIAGGRMVEYVRLSDVTGEGMARIYKDREVT